MAARLFGFVHALMPLVDNGFSVDAALFDELLNFDFNSFSGDSSLGWLMDLQ